MRPKVKICGMRSPDDISAALGADALGAVVEVPRSPRNLVLAQAAELFARIPGRILKVAVTTAKDRGLIRRILGIGPDVLQLHLELPPQGWEDVRVWVGSKAMVWGLLGIREGNRKRPSSSGHGCSGVPPWMGWYWTRWSAKAPGAREGPTIGA